MKPSLRVHLDRAANHIKFIYQDEDTHLEKGGSLVTEGGRDVLSSLRDLAEFIRSEHNFNGWLGHLRPYIHHLRKELFSNNGLKEVYEIALRRGKHFSIIIEEVCKTRNPQQSIVSGPIELWQDGDTSVLLHYPVLRQIISDDPLVYPAKASPDVIVLIEGGPPDEKDPAEEHVRRVMQVLKQRKVHTFTKIIRISWDNAKKSHILSVLKNPIGDCDGSTRINGFIHWVSSPCRDDNDGDVLRLLSVHHETEDRPIPFPLRELVEELPQVNSNVVWQFFYVSSCVEPGREKDVEYPEGFGIESDILEDIAKRVPAVLGFMRPIWKKVSVDLSVAFYLQLFDYKERPLHEALFEARRVIHGNHRNPPEDPYCPFSWIAPVLISQPQATEESEDAMKLVGDLIEAYFGSLGDPKEPARIVLKDVIRNVRETLYPEKTIADIYIESLFRAINAEPKTQGMDIQEGTLRDWLRYRVNLADVDLNSLSEEQFFSHMIPVLEKNLPIEGGTEDRQQVIRNLLKRTRSEVIRVLSSGENEALWRDLMAEQATRHGQKTEDIYLEIQQILPGLRLSFVEMTRMLTELGVDVSDARGDISKIRKMIADLSGSPLDDTKEGKQIIQRVGKSPSAMPMDVTLVRRSIDQYEEYKKLAYAKYLNFVSVPESRDKYWQCFKEILSRLARLYSGQGTASDLKAEDIVDCVNN